MVKPSPIFVVALVVAGGLLLPPGGLHVTEGQELFSYQSRTLRAAIEDLIETHGLQYPQGREYLRRLDELAESLDARDPAAQQQFERLRREALLANPLLDFDRLLFVKRKSEPYVPSALDKKIGLSNSLGADLGFPSNHECNSSLPREGYDNEIAVLSLRDMGRGPRTLYRPDADVYVGEMDLHWDGQRLLFTQSGKKNWSVWEFRADGTGLRDVSRMPDDVDSFDACYLPNGKIVFGSTASYQAVPCWHGRKWVSNLYLMDADGANVRQLCFDQDHDFHPCVLGNGQVLFHRWDYTGINHIFMRQLMVMNPDGTGQRAVYGSNSWYPNALYFPQPFPGESHRLACILAGYHGVHRMGQFVLADTSRGWYGADGLVRRISGKGDSIKPKVQDALVNADWPKFLHPYPLSDKHFLVACWPHRKANWGIYLADAFDNLLLLYEEPGHAMLEPIPIAERRKPPAIPEKVDPSRDDAVVYLHDVYAGPGLAGVPRGTVQSLRVLAYHFGYRHLAGPDKIGYGGPWEAMRILGTVPLEADGSVMFRVPANTPIAVQPLDAEGKAVQLMRSWFTAMPGEVLSCVGCHESPAEATPPQLATAAQRRPRDIEPWYGPARGFDFAREVQPVLNKYCVACHDGRSGRPDLRAEELVPDYQGLRLSKLGVNRLHPAMSQDTDGYLKYTPAYDALIPYVRRVGIEDDVSLLMPGEYHADTSPLIQMLQRGHQGVELNAEAWDRLVTWIDLNGPCHGTWGDVYPIPDGAHERRMALRRAYGGPPDDPETVPDRQPFDETPVEPASPPAPTSVRTASLSVVGASQVERIVDLGQGVTMKLVRAPSFEGGPVFWIGACEVTNRQFQLFDPSHDARYYQKRHVRSDDRGLPLNGPNQPAVRVSWDSAMDFCRWLSDRTRMAFTLPTEDQWEHACRAGRVTSLGYGALEDDFSPWANVGDLAFAGLATVEKRRAWEKGKAPQITGGVEHLAMEGAALARSDASDGAVVTADVGSYRPNPWGLHDMHGNAAEWTQTACGTDHWIVKGGSFYDPPRFCRSDLRVAYPAWQRVFNVGFRVVCTETDVVRVTRAQNGE